jgi:hypothetical protein
MSKGNADEEFDEIRFQDNGKISFGDDEDTDIFYNGTALVIHGRSAGVSLQGNLAMFGATAVAQQVVSATGLTTITSVTATGTSDFAIQAAIGGSDAKGFASLDEANSFIEVVKNVQTRQKEIEVALKALGILA